jgi:hypothetical protein
MFWNLARFNGGVPLLAGLVAGAAARAAEQDSQEELVEHTLQVQGRQKRQLTMLDCSCLRVGCCRVGLMHGHAAIG